MIYSETIEIVHSNLEIDGVFSEEDPDYRRLTTIRVTEESEPRKTEDEEFRIIES